MKLIYVLLYAATIIMPGLNFMNNEIVTGTNHLSLLKETPAQHKIEAGADSTVLNCGVQETTTAFTPKEEAFVNKQSLPMILVVE